MAYNTRSGARAPANPNLPTADNTIAGAVREPAGTQAVPDPTVAEINNRSTVTGHTQAMANFAQSLKDPKILMLRAEFNLAHKTVDEKNVEIDKLISYIEQAKKDSTVPKELVHSYIVKLDQLLVQGNNQLEAFTEKQNSLNIQLDYLSLCYEDQPALREPVDVLKNKVRAVFSPYKGRFQEKRDKNNHLLGSLYSAEGGVPSAMSLPPPTTMVTHQRKDYSYLKPAILSSNCTRRELSKFSSECNI